MNRTSDNFFAMGYAQGKVDVLDKIKEEITEYKDDKIIHAEQNGMIDIVLGIIDKYRNEVSE